MNCANFAAYTLFIFAVGGIACARAWHVGKVLWPAPKDRLRDLRYEASITTERISGRVAALNARLRNSQ